MAGASMNDIKARMKSVHSTMQITKAMELVATSKLRRAKERAESTRPFREISEGAVRAMLACAEARTSVYAAQREERRVLYVVVAGDRGLAGGFNNNIFRLTAGLCAGAESCFLPIGKKALDHYRHRGETVSEEFGICAVFGVGDAMKAAKRACELFCAGDVDRVELVFTRFASMISQVPHHQTLLPLRAEEGAGCVSPLTDDTSLGDLLDRIVPQYLGGIIYSAVEESVAAECGARRCAMNAANKNAGEMIDSLTLKFNRARQAQITQEITEIVSGAEAL